MDDPSNFIEASPIKGPVDRMINQAINYIKTTVIQELVHKPADRAESIRTFNYPLQALEEAIANALYHRDYLIQAPVKIVVEPHCMTISNFEGPIEPFVWMI